VTRSPLDAPGTPEAVWRAWTVPATWPTLSMRPAGRAVIACPHPDDETLAIGGIISMLVRAGWSIDVVAVTDGERSHPPTATRNAAALAARRRDEQRRALDLLGLDPARVHRLGIGDTLVSEHTDRVAAELAALLQPGDWLLAPWEHDGHRDHDAAGRAAIRAATAAGARLLRWPLWAWHWTTPEHPWLENCQPLRADLDAAALDAKRRAIDIYRSQTTATGDSAAILPPEVLERHKRDWEVLLA
jgi:LmbE family N-acetylglucosaminyl deacetylase